MIVKKRRKPDQMLALEALERRTSLRRDDIEKDLTLVSAGFRGEESLDYHLQLLPPHYQILHDVRLPIDHQFIQLDPLLQVRRQKNYLRKWLNAYRYPDLPIETLIVISKPSTIIHTSNPSVIHSAYLPFIINELDSKYAQRVLGQNELLRMGEELKQAHVPRKIDVLQNYKIKKEELRVGVHCPSCRALPMNRGYGKWKCSICGLDSVDAHIESLRDYRLLVEESITNRELRWFLQIDSESIARSII
ncbi:nuclease-related domain-containing protein [Halobacillus sp. B23F22_1]|uniref:nuclease-related domain-containing protein n=1 Tax=Halobacillus sp. B23F22_1 TaxID=3459514 RepID=UPI00373F258C